MNEKNDNMTNMTWHFMHTKMTPPHAQAQFAIIQTWRKFCTIYAEFESLFKSPDTTNGTLLDDARVAANALLDEMREAVHNTALFYGYAFNPERLHHDGGSISCVVSYEDHANPREIATIYAETRFGAKTVGVNWSAQGTQNPENTMRMALVLHDAAIIAKTIRKFWIE